MDRAWLCHRAIAPSAVTVPRGQWAQTGTQDPHPEHQETFFHCRDNQELAQGAQRGCGFASLVMLKTHLDTVLGDWLGVAVFE